MNISVAMASYNGEKYIEDQINSILCQLHQNDELVISDDGSSDNTLSIINRFCERDKRIKLYHNKDNGIIKNFENAIKNTVNEIILLCDQDDIWLPNKIERMVKEFEINPEVTLVISDLQYVDSDLNEVKDELINRKYKKGILKNFIKNSYIGCCMAFNKEIKKTILPFPQKIPMHDAWIGILAELFKYKIVYIPEKLILYRRHENTATTSDRNKLNKIIKWRFYLMLNLVQRCFCIKNIKKGEAVR
ncbi:glycosyltransferase family 2 protein [Alkalibacter saccharofermentans]|uniref:Glycosyl transferase family 2 n=1 Tax=Alkalibacter saccharofermentans DSM 14828 TaxID=1120975 RepID=A0A1M4WPH0_9FIRM|nr:glycosyltransferase family 2 protein [Alkalibacter saccharofermentans]SHE83114.1 Glycosyl transferase family 2 [Alkalibacter saccharofermentans DSM 14828]